MGLSAFSFVFSKWHACSIGLRSGNWLGHCRMFNFFYLQKLRGCFCCMFWVIVHLYYEAPCNHQTPVTQCHWKPCTLMPSHCFTMFHRWCCMLWIMSCSKPSPYFFLPVILVQVDLKFSHPKNAFPEVVFFRYCLANLALFAPCGEASVSALYSLLLIVVFDCDASTSWRVFFSWLDVVKWFFLYHGEDPLIIHPCCPLWMSSPLYVAELTSSFFLRFDHSYNVPAISLMDLFSFWSLTIVCFTFMERFLDHIMWVHTSQQPLPNATLIRWTTFHSGRLNDV